MSSRNTNENSLVEETPVGKKTIESPRKARSLEHGIREEAEEVDYDGVHGGSNAGKEASVFDDDVEALFSQMMLTEIKEKRDAPKCLFRGYDEERLQQGKALEEEGWEEKVQQTRPSSGFDFHHLKVLREIPLSSFYGIDLDNLILPLQTSSNVGSFYGFDKESLAAENAALDEFYARIKSEKAALEKDQSSGKI